MNVKIGDEAHPEYTTGTWDTERYGMDIEQDEDGRHWLILSHSGPNEPCRVIAVLEPYPARFFLGMAIKEVLLG